MFVSNKRYMMSISHKTYNKSKSIDDMKQKNLYSNNIRKLLYERGFKAMTPTKELLASCNMNENRWREVLNQKVTLRLDEAISIANWLNVDVKELRQDAMQEILQDTGLVDFHS
jgi:hypothetical protein